VDQSRRQYPAARRRGGDVVPQRWRGDAMESRARDRVSRVTGRVRAIRAARASGSQESEATQTLEWEGAASTGIGVGDWGRGKVKGAGPRTRWSWYVRVRRRRRRSESCAARDDRAHRRSGQQSGTIQGMQTAEACTV
jgi:hypothetical protein